MTSAVTDECVYHVASQQRSMRSAEDDSISMELRVNNLAKTHCLIYFIFAHLLL